MMKVADLLRQRVMVAQPIPFKPEIAVGTIYTLMDDMPKDMPDRYKYYHNDKVGYVLPEEVYRCPETFVRLKWYNMRSVEDMPAYVSIKQGKEVRRVAEWVPLYLDNEINDWKVRFFGAKTYSFVWFFAGIEPISIYQFRQHIRTNHKKTK